MGEREREIQGRKRERYRGERGRDRGERERARYRGEREGETGRKRETYSGERERGGERKKLQTQKNSWYFILCFNPVTIFYYKV